MKSLKRASVAWARSVCSMKSNTNCKAEPKQHWLDSALPEIKSCLRLGIELQTAKVDITKTKLEIPPFETTLLSCRVVGKRYFAIAMLKLSKTVTFIKKTTLIRKQESVVVFDFE